MNIQLSKGLCNKIRITETVLYLCTEDKGHSGPHEARGLTFEDEDVKGKKGGPVNWIKHREKEEATLP